LRASPGIERVFNNDEAVLERRRYNPALVGGVIRPAVRAADLQQDLQQAVIAPPGVFLLGGRLDQLSCLAPDPAGRAAGVRQLVRYLRGGQSVLEAMRRRGLYGFRLD
jgi:hypothetical protein